MHEYVVTRVKIGGENSSKEYRTKKGAWSTKISDAYRTSEEDAKAIERVCASMHYSYEYELVH